MEMLVRPPRRGDRMIGHTALPLPNVATLQIDHAPSLAALRRAGYRVAPPLRRICHWSPYLRPGLFPLYRAFLDDRLPLRSLRALLPEDTAPRWSRLLPLVPRWTGVPTERNASAI